MNWNHTILPLLHVNALVPEWSCKERALRAAVKTIDKGLLKPWRCG